MKTGSQEKKRRIRKRILFFIGGRNKNEVMTVLPGRNHNLAIGFKTYLLYSFSLNSAIAGSEI